LVLVTLSATTEVNKLSIAPKAANVIAGIKIKEKSENTLKTLKFKAGNPEGISPIIFTSIGTKIASTETKIKATKVLGITLVIKGNRYIIIMVSAVIPRDGI